MKSKKTRVAILIVAIAIIAGLLACEGGGRIAQVTPTPTKTPKPTFTATPLPTDTPIPTDTPLPTDTPVPPTSTPIIMTATFTPPPTDTATPLPPTATTKPTSKPTSKPKATSTKTPIPAPTNTPVPAFEYKAIHQTAYDSKNCGSTGVTGKVYSSSNAGTAGVRIAVWADGWEGTISNPSGSDGKWDVLLNDHPVAGNWRVRAVDPATCQTKNGSYTAQCTGWRSDEVVVSTSFDCNTGIQWAVVDFKHN